MSGRGFVDKNLFGLKDKLNTYQTDKNLKKTNIIDSSKEKTNDSKNPEKISNEEISNKPNTIHEISVNHEEQLLKSEKSVSKNTRVNQFEEKNTKITEKPKLDKDYIKALAERKEEFIHKRSDIIKRIQLNLNKLPNDIKKYEKFLTESKSVQRKLELTLEKIYTINEKSWDKNDYTLELAEAVRTTENARLELFTLQQNYDCLIEENIPGLEKNSNASILPELTSLTFRQIFKMGLGFFLPLVIGILFAAGVICIGMFIAMGII